MNAATYCKNWVVTVEPQADLAQAASRMRSSHVGMLIVVPPGENHPIGVLTDRDIVVQVVAKGMLPAQITVADAMTRDPVVARHDDLLGTVSERMRTHGVRRLPVVNAHGELVGVIASDDLLDISATVLFNLSSAAHKEQCTERRSRQ